MPGIQFPFESTSTRKRSTGVLIFLFWTLVAAIFTTKSNLYYTFNGVPTSWLHLSIHHLASAWTWVLLTPMLFGLYNYIREHRSKILSQIIILFSFLPIIGFSHRALALILDISFRKYVFEVEGSVLQNLGDNDSIFISGIFDSTLTAFLIIGVFFMIEVLKKIKENTNSEDHKDNLRGKLMVKQNGQYIFLNPLKVMAITAEGNYVKLHLEGKKSILVRQTMTKFLDKLNVDKFLRVNRSFIANVDHVQSLQHKFNGEYILKLTDGIETTTSKRFGDSWKRLLNHK
jgi:LytTr DNA-binding domain